MDELEQRCFHLQADYDTTKQELKQTQQKLQNLRQEPKVPSQQKSSSPQASAGDNSTDRKESYQVCVSMGQFMLWYIFIVIRTPSEE